MKLTFVDTSFLLALILTDDQHHSRAIGWQRVLRGGLLTTEYVLVEFLDALVREPLRKIANDTVTILRSDENVEIVGASTRLLDSGMALFKSHDDKTWGLTDCISFLVMREKNVHEALTSDHHFEQAGFRALLRLDPQAEGS